MTGLLPFYKILLGMAYLAIQESLFTQKEAKKPIENAIRES